jgi:hypothetical protein
MAWSTRRWEDLTIAYEVTDMGRNNTYRNGMKPNETCLNDNLALYLVLAFQANSLVMALAVPVNDATMCLRT